MQTETLHISGREPVEVINLDIPNEEGQFTHTERELFWVLYNANGRAISEIGLYEHLYQFRPECEKPSDLGIVKVFICKLRKKLKHHKITCHYRYGYAMTRGPVAEQKATAKPKQVQAPHPKWTGPEYLSKSGAERLAKKPWLAHTMVG